MLLALPTIDMLKVLCHGRYEPLKASVHGTILGLAALCTAYNFAAWRARKQRHSWVNTAMYGLLTLWEFHHVRHHLTCRIVTTRNGDEQRAA